MNMKDVIASWFAWLRSAVSAQEQPLSAVYSDGRQLWAGDGYRLHALDVALGQPGRVIVNEDGLFQVEAASDIPALAAALPEGEPAGLGGGQRGAAARCRSRTGRPDPAQSVRAGAAAGAGRHGPICPGDAGNCGRGMVVLATGERSRSFIACDAIHRQDPPE